MSAVAVIDDNPVDLSLVQTLLADELNNLVRETGQKAPAVDSFASGEALLRALRDGRSYNVFFLDVMMGSLSGIATARSIAELNGGPFSLVFITGSSDFALEAFDVNAVDYLVKPIQPAMLRRALSRCHLFQNVLPVDTITLMKNKMSYRLVRQDISYIESYAHVCVFHTGDQEFSTYMTMDAALKTVQDDAFVRCHKSFIVNLRHVQSINGSDLTMKDGAVIPIGRSMRREIHNLYDDYLIRRVWERRRND